MAAHLYWRLNVSQNNGTTGVAVAEIILRTSPGGAQAATGGTPGETLNGSSSAGGPSNAFDGNAGTWWNPYSPGVNTQLRYQFASAVDIVEYAIQFRNDNSLYLGDAPKAFTLEYSDDGSAWTVADNVRNQGPWTLGETRTFTVGANTGNPAGQSVGTGLIGLRPAVAVTPASASQIQLGKAPATSARTVSGTVTVGGVATGGLLVRAYAKATGEYIGQAASAGDGSYSINCGNVWTDVYVIAFDPTTYRAVTYDQVVPG